jgi:hypothetical protein
VVSIWMITSYTSGRDCGVQKSKAPDTVPKTAPIPRVYSLLPSHASAPDV